MTRYNGAVITAEDFKRENSLLENRILSNIERSKSINKLWLAHCKGFDVDYTPDENEPQDLVAECNI